ncbi:aspartate/glutamate racemase family protein [Vibrio sp.]|nr:aspartate/glutamate racemase family protein [Vibrio sp.]
MIINLINPNTSTGMTEAMARVAKSVAHPSSIVVARSPEHGPKSIECAFDEAVACAAMLDVVQMGEEEGVDAHIIACFGDPGLEAAREVARAPVIGIAEAAFKLATLISSRFSIVTTMCRTIPMSHHLLKKYGYEHYCASVLASDIPVLDLENITADTYNTLKADCLKAIEVDGAESIILGCAGMANLAQQLTDELGVPVIDGVCAAIKLSESLYQLNLTTSKKGQYAEPISKPFIGRYQHWNR